MLVVGDANNGFDGGMMPTDIAVMTSATTRISPATISVCDVVPALDDGSGGIDWCGGLDWCGIGWGCETADGAVSSVIHCVSWIVALALSAG